MRIGVVADDITGANDIGSMFTNGGYRAYVYAAEGFDPARDWHGREPTDVCIVDTNSRLDSRDDAYRKVFHATQQLQAAGCRQFFNKTCSVFRGNIGAEFDAMLDALREEFAVVVLGFPKNGRLTLDGIHYVHGQRLEDSPFRSDPIHPTTHSNVVEILQAQTERKVALIDYRVIERGAEVLRACIEKARVRCQYLVLDVSGQEALRTIAQATHDYPVFCGSSALAEELPAVWGDPPVHVHDDPLPPRSGVGVLCAAGSLTPQTLAQIDYLKTQGAPIVEIDTVRLLDNREQAKEIAHIVPELVRHLKEGRHPLVHAANDPDIVARTQSEGARRGRSKVEVGRLIADTLAEIVARAVEDSGCRRLVIAGGETSAAVCRRLGIQGMRVWKEIRPGLPSCVSLTEPRLLLVLKSGSFGTTEFLQEAIDHVQTQ